VAVEDIFQEFCYRLAQVLLLLVGLGFGVNGLTGDATPDKPS
jgi:hypothetical protein